MHTADDLRRTIADRIGPTVHEFAEAVGKGPQTMRRYADAGMPCVYVGRTRHVVMPDALDWITARGRMPTSAGRPRRPRAEQPEKKNA